jgi:hypothetical protein
MGEDRLCGAVTLAQANAAKAENDKPRSMKPPETEAAISHAKQAERAAACIAETECGAGARAWNQIESRNSA